jgi:molecular chaperone GrpE (heat shock protein)
MAKIDGMSWEAFAERQIVNSQLKGEFKNIALGKPLENLDTPWVASWLKRNDLSLYADAQDLRKDVEKSLQEIFSTSSEKLVLRLVPVGKLLV